MNKCRSVHVNLCSLCSNYPVAEMPIAIHDNLPSTHTTMKALLFTVSLTLALTSLVQAGPPVNEVCPVCGKNARLIFRTNAPNGDRVIFATSECKDKFEKNPGGFKVTKKAQ